MPSPVVIIWGILLLVFVGIPGFYYFYMKRFSRRFWNVGQNENYHPKVTFIIPARNEEKIIRLKLENSTRLEYPKDKLWILIVNDGSDDNTVKEIREFQTSNPSVDFKVLDSSERIGKANSLNSALESAMGEIIVVSDADCFLSPNALHKALTFLADPSVGAVTGLETLLNPKESWVTETEMLYNDAIHTIRTGESKVYATVFFQGGFAAFKRSLLDRFDARADDSGTALNIVQKGARTLLLREVVYFTIFSSIWRRKLVTKLRRAAQLVRIWCKCIRLFMMGKLLLPKKIFFPEAFLYLVNPFVFVFLIVFSVLVFFENPILILAFSSFLLCCLTVRKARTLLIEAVQDHIVLLWAIVSVIFGRDFSSWSTIDASRASLSREMLERRGLV